MMLGDRDALEECGKGTAVCFKATSVSTISVRRPLSVAP